MSDLESHKDFSDYEEDYEIDGGNLSKNSSAAQIGLIDCKIKEDDVIEVEDIVLGGAYINKNIPKKFLACKLCKKTDSIRLLLKTFIPVEEDSEFCLNSDDRWLYLIQCNSCINRDGSIKCIREIKYNEGIFVKDVPEDEEPKIVSDVNPFVLDKANPFASQDSNPFAAKDLNPFAPKDANPFSFDSQDSKSKVDTLKTKSLIKVAETESKKKHDLKPDLKVNINESYSPFFVYLDKERFNSKPESKTSKTNFDNIQIDDPSINLQDLEKSSDVKEVEVDPLVSKLTTSLTDPQFNKFTNILEYNPDQILRLSTTPIFFKSDAFVKSYYSKKGLKTLIPKLEGSRDERQFELQLMPYAISKLESELDIDLKNVGMEWGTILVFTDPKSFTPEGRGELGTCNFVEEFVYVQWDD
ncbi:hypothetical protein QEN19_001349 [Hanseniaspora menglaensis]